MKYKNLLVRLLMIFSLSIISFTVCHSQIKYQFECSSINNGSITLKIWNQKKGERLKIQQAQKSALRALLYNGITSSDNCIGQKSILNNSEAVERFKVIENDFFANKGIWITFTRSADPVNILPQTMEDEKSKEYSVIINKEQLRKYLEEKEIIKSINSIF